MMMMMMIRLKKVSHVFFSIACVFFSVVFRFHVQKVFFSFWPVLPALFKRRAWWSNKEYRNVFFSLTGHHVFAFGWFGRAGISISALFRISRWQSSDSASKIDGWDGSWFQAISITLRILQMSRGVKLPSCFAALKKSVIESDVFIGGVRILRAVLCFFFRPSRYFHRHTRDIPWVLPPDAIRDHQDCLYFKARF